MAAQDTKVDVYNYLPVPVPAASSTAAVFEAARRLAPAELSNVPQLAATPSAAAEATARIEATAGAQGYITEGQCQYDFRSAYFNPLKALYNPHAMPPYPNIAPLDNISKFRGSVSAPVASCLPARGTPRRLVQLHPGDTNCDMLAAARTARGKILLKDGTFVQRGDREGAREKWAMRNINKLTRQAQDASS